MSNSIYESKKAASTAFSANASAVGSLTADFDKIVKNSNIRYGMSYASFDDLISHFDVSRLPDYEGATLPLVGHIIFSRPSLYVDVGVSGGGGTAAENFTAMQQLPMTSAFVNDPYGQKLLHMMSEFSGSAYMPIFTNRAMSYSVNDISLKTVEKGQTYYGHVIKYGKHSEEHKIGGTVSIDFRNDRYQSILKSSYIWFSYVWNVSRSDAIKPSNTSQKNGIIDYGGSMFYLVTQMDMSRLVYWEKLTGIFPKTIPMSIFSYSDAPIVEDKISIEFDYGHRSDPCDPDVLMDLNVLSAKSVSSAQSLLNNGLTGQSWQSGPDRFSGVNPRQYKLTRPDNFEGQFGRGNAFAEYPFVRMAKQDDMLTFYLQWKAS